MSCPICGVWDMTDDDRICPRCHNDGWREGLPGDYWQEDDHGIQWEADRDEGDEDDSEGR